VFGSHPEPPERRHDPRGIPHRPKMARNIGSVDRRNGHKRNAGPQASSQDQKLGLELVPIAAGPDLIDEMRSHGAEPALRVGDLSTDAMRDDSGGQSVR